jgi:ABC-type spermidine/putrescine transport system permease subunit II
MPLDPTSTCASLAGGVAVGLGLGYWAARRPWFDLVLWVWAMIPLVVLAVRGWPAGALVAGGLAVAPVVALFVAGEFRTLVAQWNAGRSLCAGEWRIFRRVLLPGAWKAVLQGALIGLIRVAAERALAAVL